MVLLGLKINRTSGESDYEDLTRNLRLYFDYLIKKSKKLKNVLKKCSVAHNN